MNLKTSSTQELLALGDKIDNERVLLNNAALLLYNDKIASQRTIIVSDEHPNDRVHRLAAINISIQTLRAALDARTQFLNKIRNELLSRGPAALLASKDGALRTETVQTQKKKEQ